MKQILYFTYVLILFCTPVRSLAQLNHFIYLQTENKQPFYVKMEKEIFNSTISGYLIIPKLKDSSYNFSIGFLNSENKEQNFSCSINGKDAGYLVKKFADKGWGLFNLQSLQVAMSGTKEQDAAQVNKTDAFSNLLSDVVNDPTIKQDSRIKNEVVQIKVDSQTVTEAKRVELNDTVAGISKSGIGEALNKPVEGKQTAFSGITKKDPINSADGLHITYLDRNNGIEDTITVFIAKEQSGDEKKLKPEENKEVRRDDSLQNETIISGKKEDDSISSSPDNQVSSEITIANKDSSAQNSQPAAIPHKTDKKEDKKFLEIDLSDSVSKPNQGQKSVEKESNQPKPAALMINSDCKSNALEEDFLKLRRKMASSKSEEEMISNAKKAFKARCFTTDQIKNLGVLFLNDAGRYNFFDMAYPFVSDTYNFKLLEAQLTDPYYKSRFQAMIRH